MFIEKSSPLGYKQTLNTLFGENFAEGGFWFNFGYVKIHSRF